MGRRSSELDRSDDMLCWWELRKWGLGKLSIKAWVFVEQ